MDYLINYGLQVAATLLITLIGVLGTYLSMQLGKNANLNNINTAQKELIRAAKITVGELQQTMVQEMKAANNDGKLSPQEIANLRIKLIDKTVEKLDLRHVAIYHDRNREAAQALGIDALPTTLLVDEGGREVARMKGSGEWDSETLRAAIRAAGLR